MAAVLYGTFMTDNGQRVLSSVGGGVGTADCGEFQCDFANCVYLGQSGNQVFIYGTYGTRFNCNCNC